MVLLSTLFVWLISDAVTVATEARFSPQTQLSSYGNSSLTGDWKSAKSKADAFVAQLNLTEKVAIATGSLGAPCIGNIEPIDRIGFPGLCYSDGPAAVNRADLVSIFASGISAAASWDRDLIYQRGFAMGNEFRDKGVHVALNPVAGPLGRHPLGGRNWEGFSPDPYLTGVAMDASIRGTQKAGVQTSSKHFIGNEQETQRSTTVINGTKVDAISSNIDDRTLHELYLWPFADAVRAGTTSVMCSYNRLNQTYACENSQLLNDILKKELGFLGYVVSDWYATHSGAKSVNAGLDMTMPGNIDATGSPEDSYFGANLTAAVHNGSVSMARIDDMVCRIMTPYFLLSQNESYPTVDPSSAYVLAQQEGVSFGEQQIYARDVRGDHAAFIRNLGAAGTVLLKNINNTLPLKSPKNIGVFGNDAPDPTDGLTTVTDNDSVLGDSIIGTRDIGGGSGTGRHTTIISPLTAIKAKARELGSRVQYITNNVPLAAGDFRSIYPTPDVCLVFLKTFASEGWDRVDFLNDWDSAHVVKNVAGECPNTIVVTHSAGVNTMPWANNPNVTAILAAHYPGEETGNSIVDILWGDVNPGGKLPYTIPVDESDYDFPITNVTSETDNLQVNFTEGQLIDYRHFDSNNIVPLFEFGYGLSYTTFNLSSSVSVSTISGNPSPTPDHTRETVPGGNPDLWAPILQATSTVSNTGPISGATVVQLYLSMPQSSVPEGTPVKVLRGFEKVHLEPGAHRDVVFTLTRRDLSFWDTVGQTWEIPTGGMNLSAGFSSRDLKAETVVNVLE